jgi:hypothetical protein
MCKHNYGKVLRKHFEQDWDCSGHKTRYVFDRCNIVSDQDLKKAARRQFDFIRAQNEEIWEVEHGYVTNMSQSAPQPIATA